jgi:N-glycosylase/DNA lyase
MQKVWISLSGVPEEMTLPPAGREVMPGVPWGAADELFTPSFWKYQTEARARSPEATKFKLGKTLGEEIAVCLLGGYGIPAEMGLDAFGRLRDEGLLTGAATAGEIAESLSRPFQNGGRGRRYRFAAQKAAYLAPSLSAAGSIDDTVPARQLRDTLLGLPGVGLKTASWIVRNHLSSDDVAIIDIHIHRAGVHMGVFTPGSRPQRDYRLLEDAFLRFSSAISVRASILDAVMWDIMRRIGPTATKRATT